MCTIYTGRWKNPKANFSERDSVFITRERGWLRLIVLRLLQKKNVFLAACLGFLIGKSLLAQYVCGCVHWLQASVCQAKKK